MTCGCCGPTTSAAAFAKYPQLNQLFNEATKLAGAAGTKGSTDTSKADELLAKIEEINKIFWRPSRADPSTHPMKPEFQAAAAPWEPGFHVLGGPGRPAGRRGAFLVVGCGR